MIFKELADLLKTPKMRRQESGIDRNLISQVRDYSDKVLDREKEKSAKPSYQMASKARSEGSYRADEKLRLCVEANLCEAHPADNR